MKILVPIKRVVDYNVKVRPLANGADVDIANAKMSMNPFCEIAVEEAIRLKERGLATEVVVVSIGSNKTHEQLRAAMALGADRGVWVDADNNLQPLLVAKALKAVVEKEQPDLVILGKQSIDGDNNQTGQMLSALLGWPQGAFASALEVNDRRVKVTREVDGGLQTLGFNLPAVITTDLRLNEPRYATLPNIMKAKKKPLESTSLAELGINDTNRLTLLKVELPAVRKAGVKVRDVDELIDKLTNEAKVIP